MFWLGQIIISIYVLIGSAIITFIAAIISSFKSKHIWCGIVYLHAGLLLLLACLNYIDGAHCCPPIEILLALLCSITFMTLVPLFLQKVKLKKVLFMSIMWIFTIILPVVFSFMILVILCDPRPSSEETFETYLGMDLPKYRVTDVEAFSPGGDDWEENGVLHLDQTADLTSFVKELDAKCKYCEDRVIIDYDERFNEGYIECEKTEHGYKFMYRFHIEASITFDINIDKRTIAYRYRKI